MEDSILLMLSGGLDSSYLLYYLLVDTNYEIHTHHISLRYDVEPRWAEEDTATNNVINYCQKIRNFSSSESRFDFRGFGHVGWDSDLQVLVAARVAPNLRKKVRVAIGWTCDSVNKLIVKSRLERNVTANIWTACRNSVDKPERRKLLNEKLWFPLVDMGMYKKDILRNCPDDLVDLTWSCRKPVKKDGKSVPCGKCFVCKEILAARKSILST
jgi:hypothetical protein